MSIFRKALAIGGLLALVAGLSATPASAQDSLYGVTFLDNQLITVDPATGLGTQVGPLGGGNVQPFGLASADGQLYTFDSVAGNVLRIDPATGSTLASTSVGLPAVLGQGGFALQAGGVGFLTSSLDPTTLDPINALYRFDLGAGTSSLVANTPAPLEALAFDPSGTLFGLGKLDGNLYRFTDLATGALTLVGNVGVDVGSPVGALTFDAGGTLFATLDDKLYTLDPTTAAATPVGSSDPNDMVGFSSISGLAFAPAAAVVPEPSSVLLLGLGAGALGIVLRGRSAARKPDAR